jgi:hypothetical protein
MMMQLQGFPFDVAGEWVFEVLLNGERKARHRVTVLEPDPEQLGDLVLYGPARPAR